MNEEKKNLTIVLVNYKGRVMTANIYDNGYCELEDGTELQLNEKQLHVFNVLMKRSERIRNLSDKSREIVPIRDGDEAMEEYVEGPVNELDYVFNIDDLNIEPAEPAEAEKEENGKKQKKKKDKSKEPAVKEKNTALKVIAGMLAFLTIISAGVFFILQKGYLDGFIKDPPAFIQTLTGANAPAEQEGEPHEDVSGSEKSEVQETEGKEDYSKSETDDGSGNTVIDPKGHGYEED